MNLKERNKPVVDILFLLALFCVFLISALFIVLFGARIYKSCVAHMDENFKSRTALAYVTEKVRCHDHEGGVDVQKIDGKDVLILSEVIGEQTYLTYLYEKDGYLCELTADEKFDFHFAGGTQILPMQKFSIQEVSSSAYELSVVDESGGSHRYLIAVRASGEEDTANE